MALLRRRRRSPRDRGMSRFAAGLIALVLVAAGVFFAFTKANPFADPYEVRAMFQDTDNVGSRSPVRIAGVDVGKVTGVEPLDGGQGGLVTMEIEDHGLPIHEDAQLRVRPRIFLEGNKFVDLRPGSPSAPVLEDGAVIDMDQTSSSVSFGDLLTALQRDTRKDLQTFLYEYSRGLEGEGARGFNESIRYWESAYRNSSLANDATLGQSPTRDLQRVLRGQQRTFAALARDEQALKGLVTNLNTTAAAFAREDEALSASLPELRDTLEVARPALGSLNSALPSLRAFARDALPGTLSSDETLAESLPFIRQVRLLFRPSELRGAARVLFREIPALVRLNRTTIPVLRQGRALSACTNRSLVPFANAPIPHPEFPGLHNQPFRLQSSRGLTALAGESRLSDGNLSYFHSQLVPPPNPATSHPSGNQIRPAPPFDSGRQNPPHRPNEPCELQEPPNMDAPAGTIAELSSGSSSTSTTAGPGSLTAPNLEKLGRLLIRLDEQRDARQARRAGSTGVRR